MNVRDEGSPKVCHSTFDIIVFEHVLHAETVCMYWETSIVTKVYALLTWEYLDKFIHFFVLPTSICFENNFNKSARKKNQKVTR